MSLDAVAAGLQVGGLAIEILGVSLMANGYLRLVEGRWGKVALLLSALLRGASAKGADQLQNAGFGLESRLLVLRGLALVGVGFVLQAVGVLVAFFA